MTAVEVEFSELPDFTAPVDADERKAIADELASDLQDVERLMRRCEARVVSVLDRADRLGVYSVDGHRSIRSWAAATVKLVEPRVPRSGPHRTPRPRSPERC